MSPLESPKKESEPKQTVPAMSLRRFSGTKSHGAKDVMQEKESPPLEQSKISVQVTVPGDDTDDNWRGLQGDFSASLLNFLCYILNPKTCILLTYLVHSRRYMYIVLDYCSISRNVLWRMY